MLFQLFLEVSHIYDRLEQLKFILERITVVQSYDSLLLGIQTAQA